MTPTPSTTSVGTFAERHLGSNEHDLSEILTALGCESLDGLSEAVVPQSIALGHPLDLAPPASEHEALECLRRIASDNVVFRSYIGMGYYGTITPAVLRRNILENPGFYTQYTPYQAEIAQGRLEALLTFQTMVSDLTALPVSNASLLDEATAAAEAMAMCVAASRGRRRAFFAAEECHPQTLAVLRTRASSAGIALVVDRTSELDRFIEGACGALLAYPNTDGRLDNPKDAIEGVHAAGALAVVTTDLLALTLARPPGDLGADIAVGSAQRLGVPMGFGGPHAAFVAARDELKRLLPGRIVGVSHTTAGRLAYRLAIQTREQHIRRDRATSNICTSQVLLAVIAAMYACYHGPCGLRSIAERIHRWTALLGRGLSELGYRLGPGPRFDTLRVLTAPNQQAALLDRAQARRINLRAFPDGALGIALDETVHSKDLQDLLEVFAGRELSSDLDERFDQVCSELPAELTRSSPYLSHPVFNSYHSEHEMLRYLRRLESRDLSLTTSMIPLGSCTMKLNASSAMLPITWPEFSGLHPFCPRTQWRGYARLCSDLERWLAEITGFSAVSLQPNSGAQGEYAGLLAIRAYHASRNQRRDICLIPVSAHGTNPASAVMAGLRVVGVGCDAMGNVDIEDLEQKARTHADVLAALMLTYPSTHGVFEARVREICEITHRHGGQVYLDGANMNAQVGLCRPGDYGADVCHINLHKTFAIPHGGGGPGMGPIAVAEHLEPFVPGHPLESPEPGRVGPVAAAPFGSASILPISWMYIAMLGPEGLKRASQVAIANANYMAHRLKAHYPILYLGETGFCAHEFIVDARAFKKTAGIDVEDIAKRLMDYGFHSPTMSFPVPGTLMIEPTESESKQELDRFCDAMISIREDIRALEQGRGDPALSALRHAPHTADVVTQAEWTQPYSRQHAAFPASWTRDHKYWPPVGRIDNAAGDRHLVCVCPPVQAYGNGS
jgi:glycine dehydrogenase